MNLFKIFEDKAKENCSEDEEDEDEEEFVEALSTKWYEAS